MYINKSYFIFLFLCFLGHSVTGQFNVKIGYMFGYSPLTTHNGLQNQFNTVTPNLEQELGPLNFMNGAHVGFRQKFSEGFAVELSWENVGNNREIIGFDSGENVYTNKYFFSLRSYALGFETYIGRFGYGSTIERSKFQVKTDIIGIDLKRNISSESKYSSKFYLLYSVQEGSVTALVMKPYFQWSWGRYDLDLYETELIGSQSGANSRPWFVGLAIVFYNGRQKRDFD